MKKSQVYKFVCSSFVNWGNERTRVVTFQELDNQEIGAFCLVKIDYILEHLKLAYDSALVEGLHAFRKVWFEQEEEA